MRSSKVRVTQALVNESAESIKPFVEVWKKVQQLNQEKPVPRPVVDRERRLQEIRKKAQEERKHLEGKDVVKAISGNWHFSNVAKATSLKPIRLGEMQLPKVHYGRVLGCRIIEIGNVLKDRNEVLVEDAHGDVEVVCIYSFQPVPKSAIMLIKEPALEYISAYQEYTIPVHSPTDIEFVHESDKETLEWAGLLCWYKAERHSPEELKAQGNKLFAGGDFKGSVGRYERALRAIADPESCPAFVATLHLNLAAAQLQLECYYEAKKSVKRALGIGVDDSALRGKALYRLGGAAYGMAQWQEAVDYFEQALKAGVPRSGEELQRARARLHESLTGEYDLHHIYEQSERAKAASKLAHIDVADYMGPVEVAVLPGKGKGLVLTRDVEAGKLLLVSKAYATAAAGNGVPVFKEYINYTMAEGHGNGLGVHIVYNAMERLKKNPQTSSQLYALYAGNEKKRKVIPIEGVVDTGRIEMIHEFNGFRLNDKGEWGTAYALYLLPSFLNHSCLANTSHVKYGDVMFVYASRALKKGAELTSSYVDSGDLLAERSLRLQMRWKFECHCRLCEADRADPLGEQRREKLLEQLDEFRKTSDSFVKINAAAPQHQILAMEKLVEEVRDTYRGRDKPHMLLYDALEVLVLYHQSIGRFDKAVKHHQEAVDAVGDHLTGPAQFYQMWACAYLYPLRNKHMAKKMMKKGFEIMRQREGLDKTLFIRKYLSSEDRCDEDFVRLLDGVN